MKGSVACELSSSLSPFLPAQPCWNRVPGPLGSSSEPLLLFLPSHQCCHCPQPGLFSPCDDGHIIFHTHHRRDPSEPQIPCHWLTLPPTTSPSSLEGHAGSLATGHAFSIPSPVPCPPCSTLDCCSARTAGAFFLLTVPSGRKDLSLLLLGGLVLVLSASP